MAAKIYTTRIWLQSQTRACAAWYLAMLTTYI